MTRQKSREFAGCFAQGTARLDCRLVFAGLACDTQSSYLRGAARGARQIRRAYNGDCYNSTTESGVDLAGRVADLGDIPPRRTWQATARAYQQFAESIFREGRVPFFAGGDHAVTIPVGRALAALARPVHIVQFDAHPDLYPSFEGHSESHACVAARLLEMDHVASVTQIGVRTMNHAQEAVAARYPKRLRVVSARQCEARVNLRIHKDEPVYITLDLDVFDPGFAPGVSHPVPGGLSPRQVLDFLHQLKGCLIGMDVVELNPARDQGDRTAVLAGRLLQEGMGRAVHSKRR